MNKICCFISTIGYSYCEIRRNKVKVKRLFIIMFCHYWKTLSSQQLTVCSFWNRSKCRSGFYPSFNFIAVYSSSVVKHRCMNACRLNLININSIVSSSLTRSNSGFIKSFIYKSTPLNFHKIKLSITFSIYYCKYWFMINFVSSIYV